MKSIFVTGTDTGVGKTVVSGLLARFLTDKGYRVITQKWIQTGSLGLSADIKSHLKIMGKRKRDLGHYISHVSPYSFKHASSPHLASRLEGKTVSSNRIKKSFSVLSENFDFVIVEGAGGALVPFSKKALIIDMARELDLPVLIVSGNKLGAINHTLLTVEAIKRRNMKLVGVIFNGLAKKRENIILKDNPRIVGEITGENILGVLPRMKDKDALYRKFKRTGKKILSSLKNA